MDIGVETVAYVRFRPHIGPARTQGKVSPPHASEGLREKESYEPSAASLPVVRFGSGDQLLRHRLHHQRQYGNLADLQCAIRVQPEVPVEFRHGHVHLQSAVHHHAGRLAKA